MFSVLNEARGMEYEMKKYFLLLFCIVLVSCTPKSGDSNEQIDSLNQEINDLNRENKLLNDELKYSVSKNDIMLTQIFEYIDESRADLIDTRFYALYDANQIEVGDRFGDLSVSDIMYYNDVNKSEGYNLAFDGQIEVLGTLGEPHEGENLVVNVLDDSRFLIPNYYPDSGIALSIVNFDDFPELSYNSSENNTTFYFELENIQLDGEEGSDFIYTSKLISYRRFN